MPDDVRRSHDIFVQRVTECANVGQVVDMAMSTWHALNNVLSPVIGQRGFFELYKRSLYVNRILYPWLLAVYEDAKRPDDFTGLRDVLLQRTMQDATESNDKLMQTFYDILGKLIGEPLAERLLRSLWEKPSSGHPAQDTSS
ncbi:hypothetical protein [Uliginosibacterium gangwonense]|uniref:hypothetical protein n=1 Tax=Uliginosibacterium gangwonense TaxID=392736 RepID=UPI000375C204|nr:hypothetical protein [Uliginosibacterium gangwonense]